METVLIRKGYISSARPDGNLKRIAQIISYGKLEEGEKEIEKLLDQYMEQVNDGNLGASFVTMFKMVKKASDYQIYGFFAILSELL